MAEKHLRQTSEVHMLLAVAIVALGHGVAGSFPTYFMDDWCSTTLDMAVQGVEAGRLLLRPPDRGLRFLHCPVFLKAPPGKRIAFKFQGFDIQSPYDCSSDNLQLFDDRYLQQELTGAMCNTGLVPAGIYTSTGEDAAVRLYKSNYLGDQIELIFSAFHLAPCREGEFHCQNAHCIAREMYCDDYDNCGDGSDMCVLGPAGVAGVVAASVIVILIIAAIVAAVLCRRHRQRRREKMRARGHARNNGAARSERNENSEMVEVHDFDAWGQRSGVLTAGASQEAGFAGSKSVEDIDTMKTPRKKSKRTSKHKRSGRTDKAGQGLQVQSGEVSKGSSVKKVRYNIEESDIYAIPDKPSWKKPAWSEACCNGSLQTEQSHAHPGSCTSEACSAWSRQQFESDATFQKATQRNEMQRSEMQRSESTGHPGMQRNGNNNYPVYELDVTGLEEAHGHVCPAYFSDHVFSFRRYPSGRMWKRNKMGFASQGTRQSYERLQQDQDCCRKECRTRRGCTPHSGRSYLATVEK